MHFTDTEIGYRDDNRHLWIYIEESDDEHMFVREEPKLADDEMDTLPPRHYQ